MVKQPSYVGVFRVSPAPGSLWDCCSCAIRVGRMNAKEKNAKNADDIMDLILF